VAFEGTEIILASADKASSYDNCAVLLPPRFIDLAFFVS